MRDPCPVPSPRGRHARAAWPTSLALLMASAVPAGPAWAEANPWYLGASQTLSHRSNLLSLAKRSLPPAGLSASDNISSTALIVGLNQPVSRQRVYADLTLRADRYDRNKIYDNDGWSLRAGVEGTAAERLEGGLTLRSSRQLSALNTPETGLQLQRNQETNNAIDLSARLGGSGPLGLLMGAGRLTVDNSADLPSVRALNLRQHHVETGLRWQDSEALRTELRLRRTRGNHPDFGSSGDRFRRNELEASALWRPRGNSVYELQLTWVDARYDVATGRDFDGLTGRASWRWDLGGRTRSQLLFVRTTGQTATVQNLITPVGSLEAVNDYSRTNDTLQWRLDYRLSPKLSLNTVLSHTQRQLFNALSFAGLQQDARGREKSERLALGAAWTPTRWLQTGCDTFIQRRQGRGTLGSDLKASGFSCYLQASMQ